MISWALLAPLCHQLTSTRDSARQSPMSSEGLPLTSLVTEVTRTAVRTEAAPDHRGGQRLAQYELIRELGRGGMGAVFLARDIRLGRRVALKLMDQQGELRAQRFLAEARATARCKHENIVVIHDVGEADGQPYMVLEYLEGPTLSVWLKRRQHRSH